MVFCCLVRPNLLLKKISEIRLLTLLSLQFCKVVLLIQYVHVLHFFLQMFNAKQLTEWCLYVIALNFTRFEGLGKELDLVVNENSQFFEKHTRPLQGYLRILESKDKWISLNRRQLHRKAKSCLPHKCTIL